MDSLPSNSASREQFSDVTQAGNSRFLEAVQQAFSRRPKMYLALIVVVLYGLAFNIYVPPLNGDDVTYYDGARSLAAGEGFKEQGKWIIDWPPVQSALVALAMTLTGVREYYIAKLVNVIAVIVSLALAHRLMVQENRLRPGLSCALIAIFPTSLVTGTAGQADFSYFAFSLLFILLVAHLRSHRSLPVALLCGLVLGITSLTRWQGVLLGVCLVFQALELGFNTRRFSPIELIKASGLEVVASLVGAGIFISWKVWLQICIANGLGGVSNYDYQGESMWSSPAPLEFASCMLNLLTQLENVVITVSPQLMLPLTILVLAFMAIVAWGFVLRIRKHGWLATDVFCVVTLFLLLIYLYKESRYGIPIAPFLLDYLFRGLRDFHLRIQRWIGFSQRALQRQANLFFAVWIAGLLSFDAALIFYGDGGSMGPANQLLLSDNRDYLRGYHRDLYDVCKALGEQQPDAIVASDKFHKQMIRHYSGLETHFVGYAPLKKYDVFIQVSPAGLPDRATDILKSELDFPTSLKGRLSNPRRTGLVTLWDVADTKNEESATIP